MWARICSRARSRRPFSRSCSRPSESIAFSAGLAASTGFADAQYALGLMYDKGLGVARDAAKARDFYAKAAAQGHGTAKAALGEAGQE